VPESTETKPSGAAETRVRSLIKLGSMPAHAKEAILYEFRLGVCNPYYKIHGKFIGYKDPKMKYRAKTCNIFEIPKKSSALIVEGDEKNQEKSILMQIFFHLQQTRILHPQ
jgi:hypothetical protein